MSGGGLHLVITTPAAVLVDTADVVSLRAEDETGGFGILAGHADFLTVLPASVVRWRDRQNQLHFCAVSGGIITIAEGRDISVACRQAILGTELASLENEVQRMRLAQEESERRSRVEQARLHANTVRQLIKYLRPGQPGQAPLDAGGRRS